VHIDAHFSRLLNHFYVYTWKPLFTGVIFLNSIWVETMSWRNSSPKMLWLKYVMLVKVTTNRLTMITFKNYVWEHRYEEIIQMAGVSTLQLPRMAGKRNVTWLNTRIMYPSRSRSSLVTDAGDPVSWLSLWPYFPWWLYLITTANRCTDWLICINLTAPCYN